MGPGDLVIYVGPADYGWRGYADDIIPKQGIVYTVRAVFIGDNKRFLDAIHLEEIVNKVRMYAFVGFEEAKFPVEYFRPVNPNRIQVFRSLLVNPRKRIEVEA